MPGVNTTHHFSRGEWYAEHYVTRLGETVYGFRLQVGCSDAVHVVGLTDFDVDRLIAALVAARREGDASKPARDCRECGEDAENGTLYCAKHQLPPQDCPGVADVWADADDV